MAFTITFPTTAPLPADQAVAAWLQQRGEPVDAAGDGVIQLRALELRFEVRAERVTATLEVSPWLPLTRVVDLLFELSIFLGADVRLTGVGEVGRAKLWMLLADAQDRARISAALERAEQHGRLEDVVKRLWQIVAAIRPGRDDRWDAGEKRIVELREVGSADGISLADAAWHADEPQPGDVIPIPVEGSVHTIAWRWLSEAYPGLAEPDYTLH